jgi:transcriptional regulator with XRE-family HTH domain
MGNNTIINDFITQKSGSGPGSGQELSSRNQNTFAFRLKSRRVKLKITQNLLAEFVGVTKNAYQTWELSTNPNAKYIPRLAEKLKCSTDWLLIGEGPEPESPGGEKQTDKPEPLYNKVEIDRKLTVPRVEYNDGLDDFGKASSGLREIFDSGDPVLIPAIQANIHAFQISVRREAHIQEQTKEINDLKTRMESLERYIKEGERRQGDEGPPDGLNRRAGTDRRRCASGG